MERVQMLQAIGVMWARLWLSSVAISDHQKHRKNLIMNLRHGHWEPGTGYNFPSDLEIPEGWKGQNPKKFWREVGLAVELVSRCPLDQCSF